MYVRPLTVSERFPNATLIISRKDNEQRKWLPCVIVFGCLHCATRNAGVLTRDILHMSSLKINLRLRLGDFFTPDYFKGAPSHRDRKTTFYLCMYICIPFRSVPFRSFPSLSVPFCVVRYKANANLSYIVNNSRVSYYYKFIFASMSTSVSLLIYHII